MTGRSLSVVDRTQRKTRRRWPCRYHGQQIVHAVDGLADLAKPGILLNVLPVGLAQAVRNKRPLSSLSLLPSPRGSRATRLPRPAFSSDRPNTGHGRRYPRTLLRRSWCRPPRTSPSTGRSVPAACRSCSRCGGRTPPARPSKDDALASMSLGTALAPPSGEIWIGWQSPMVALRDIRYRRWPGQ